MKPKFDLAARVCAMILFAGICLLRPSSAQAQVPTIATNGIRNGASYAVPGLPNAAIAQGSIFVIFGDNLGPANIVQVSAFPLPTSAGLAGTSVRVVIGATTVDCIMLYTLKTQVAAVLPSSTPVGTGTIRVTYNGQTSATAPITVTARSFGIFALNQAGTGPGVIQNVNAADRPFNGATTSAHPQQVMILWGTGIGPLASTSLADEANGAGFGVDMPSVNLHVFVGAQEATVQYKGRSGCCVGIDQIVFTVPNGITGCTVPVYITVNGVVSNFVSIAITASGSTCSDSGNGGNGYSAADIATATSNGGLRVSTLAVQRFFLRAVGTPVPPRLDNVTAVYARVPLSTVLASSNWPGVGNCVVTPIPGPTLELNTPLNPGTLSIAGPVGSRTMAIQSVGSYYLYFAPGFPPTTGYITDGTLVTAGNYAFSATGGSDVGAHNASINHPATFNWNEFNSQGGTTISRSQPMTFTWTGGIAGGIVSLTAQSQSTPGVGAFVTCYADAAAGSFTIPAALMSALPVTGSAPGIPLASLQVVNVTFGGHPSIPGIDQASIIALDAYNVGPINFQ